MNAIFLLPTNLYGPRDNFDLETSHVIPALIRKMLESEDEVVLWGDGSPTREFLYVEDCVEGLVLAAERYDGPEPVNLGAGKEISIRELAELVADVTGFAGRITWDKTKPGGQPRRSVDATRARELFGFEARTPLRDGIERTVAWYRSARRVSVASASAARPAGPDARSTGCSSNPAPSRNARRRADRRDARPRARRSPQRLGLLPGRRPDLNTTTGWLLGRLELPPTEVGYLWPLVAGADHLDHGADVRAGAAAAPRPPGARARPDRAALRLRDRGEIGGRLLGYWAATLWVIAPFAAIPLFVDRYHEKWVDQFLPQALGLTALPDYPSMVLVLAAALFVVRSLAPTALADAALAGRSSEPRRGEAAELPAGRRRRARVCRRAALAGGLVFAAASSRPPRARVLEGPRARRAPGLGAGGDPRSRRGAETASRSTSTATSTSTSTTGASRWTTLREFFWSARRRPVGSVRRAASPCSAFAAARSPRSSAGWLGAFLVVKGFSTRASIEANTLLAAAHARLARLPPALRVDPAARPDPRAPARRPAPPAAAARSRRAGSWSSPS